LTETVERTKNGAILYDKAIINQISAERFVLRHYRRGGLLGKLVRDTYVFSGEDLTRSFMEWRLLDKLAANNMNVPRPAAARFCRHGTFYTADLITVRIPDVVSLSQQSVGAAIWKFHEAGVYHADMNAYNVQVDKDGDIWMLDFDKGALKSPGPWQQETLSRLHRSLRKVLDLDPRLHFRAANWEQLLQGYFNAAKSE